MPSKDVYVVMQDNYDDARSRPHKVFEERELADGYAERARRSHQDYYVVRSSLIIEDN
jgi:hypothetical protein